jgi:hypothetical protein
MASVSVSLDLATVSFGDSGLIYGVVEEALSSHWAGAAVPDGPRAAAGPGLVIYLGLQLLQELAVVPRDDCRHVRHSAVRKLHCVSVEDSLERVAIRKRRV